ncbi:MAG: GNAT family N-acetyltransferase [Spirochaetia bacterium]|nr:GNAT family N-acetyltransferase [Spirochaetota bacterium]MCX8097372.1 GNAT family N-acetyltransferase [Spirochaetota bacterium]MDW8112273.1 GNAT family N-acetyltransferase [Spirochaetia bacterium]
MFSKIYITEARTTDHDKIVELSRDLFEYSSFRVDDKVVKLVGRDNIHKVIYGILESSTGIFLAVSGGRILGFLSWAFDRNLTRLTSKGYYRIKLLGVDKEFQRKGIGSILLKYFIDFVKKQKGDIIEVSTDANNTAASNLYLKFGFLYTSSFGIFRYFSGINNSKSLTSNINVVKVSSQREMDDFVKVRSRNNDVYVYPIQCIFDRRFEDKVKQDIIYNYHKLIEASPSIFRMYVAYHSGIPVGYGVVKEDFSLSSLLSRISERNITVYRIFDLFVVEEQRRQGIGSEILDFMLSDIPKDYNFVETIVPIHNYGMINTLKKVDFSFSHSMINFSK